MGELNFIVNYNVTLFNFVDTLAKWDYFVGGHIREYYDKYYSVSPKGEEYLSDYASQRKSLGWEQESSLFDWANGGYANNTQFDALLNAIRNFEKQEDDNGNSLQSELENATENLEKLLPSIESKYQELEITDNVEAAIELFETPVSDSNIDAYITYSPVQSTMGGANGHNIYTQVSSQIDDEAQVRQAIAVLAHEYMHKVINPGRYFRQLDHEFYEQSFIHRYPDPYYLFTEEAVVYTMNDVITFNVDPDEKFSYYSERYDDDEQNRKHATSLWASCKSIEPILLDYFNSAADKASTLARLDEFFRSFIVNK